MRIIFASASSLARRWLYVATTARPARRIALAVRDASSYAPQTLRELQKASPAVQQWLKTLEAAPCLVCGERGGRATVDCAVSGFPLTCSPECDRVAAAEKAEELRVFRQIHDDLAYTASADAKTLLAHVLTRDRRAEQQKADAIDAHASSWETFTRQFTDDPRWIGDARAVRLTSVVYTFVATLSNFLPVLRSDYEPVGSDRMELHVVGARAEAMMPRHIWAELEDAHPRATFNIKLVGDHVVQMPRKKNKRLAAESLGRVQLEHYSGFYHHVVAAEDGLATPPHAYALFNPGIGHPILKASWRPTVEMILKSGAPALLTSFSQRDQERDVQTLREMRDVVDVDFVVPPQENPFSSRCFQLDPADVFAPIRTNSHVMVVRGRVRE